MPGQTTTKLPYPLSTEPVADGADAIKNLANAVDPRLPAVGRTGNVTVNINAAQSGSTAVTLPGSFAGFTPRVFTNIATSGLSRLLTTRAVSPTSTGFTLFMHVADLDATLTAAATVQWHAVVHGTTSLFAADEAAELDPGMIVVTVACGNSECPAYGVPVDLVVPDGTNPDAPAPSSYWCGECDTEIEGAGV